MPSLRDEVEKLIWALIAIPREQRTPAMNRLLVGLVAAIDEYDAADEPDNAA